MDIIMPQLGETVLEGLVSVWYKKPGDRVAADESLFEVETEKVSTEIPSPVAGVLREILVDAGVTVKVGTRLAIIDPVAAAATAPRAHLGAAAPAAALVPTLAPGSTAQTAVAPGAAAKAGAPAQTGMGGSGANPIGRTAGARLSPVVRRLLGEAGLGADQVRGSGRDGRITREDALAYIAAASPLIEGAARAPAVGPAVPAPASAGVDDRIVPLNKIRRATAAHMVRSVATSPHTLQAIEVDFHNVERARMARASGWAAQEGFSLSYLPFICAAVCEALAEFPYVNSSFGSDELIVHKRIHLGIAVDLSFNGLLAPVLRDADRRNLRGLALEIAALVARTRANALAPDELKGGTYTISNSGSFGTLITAPIINQPQVAILSTDGVRKKPVVIEGPEGDAIAIRPVGVLAQSFDHRAFDGAYSAAFLRRVRQALETRDWLSELSQAG
jgi:pyruvate dehydrogenase E2 component (dihydrolipoamide acetyltransferase)